MNTTHLLLDEFAIFIMSDSLSNKQPLGVEQTTFLSLPHEVHDLIYEFALVKTRLIVVWSARLRHALNFGRLLSQHRLVWDCEAMSSSR
jgi:hypothetical protein